MAAGAYRPVDVLVAPAESRSTLLVADGVLLSAGDVVSMRSWISFSSRPTRWRRIPVTAVCRMQSSRQTD